MLGKHRLLLFAFYNEIHTFPFPISTHTPLSSSTQKQSTKCDVPISPPRLSHGMRLALCLLDIYVIPYKG